MTQTLGIIGQRNLKKWVREFVELGVDNETVNFYQKGRVQAIFSIDKFVNSISGKIMEEPEIPESRLNRRILSMSKIVTVVAKHFDVEEESILINHRGRGCKNIARSISLYLCRKHAGFPLSDYRNFFWFKSLWKCLRAH